MLAELAPARPRVQRVDARALRRLARRRVDDVLSARHAPWMAGQDERPTPWAQGGAAFTPKSIAGLALWLRADLGIALNGSTVSAWADQSGHGNNVSQATGTKQPTFTASDASYAGQPTLTFVEANLQVLSGAFGFSQPLTVYWVGEAPEVPGNNTGLFVGAPGPAMVYAAGTAQQNAILNAGAALNGTHSVASKCAVCAVFDGASSALYVDSSQAPDVSGNGGTNNPTTTFFVGGDGVTYCSYLQGKVAEVAAYTAVHSAAQVAQLFRYFGQRYGGAWS